MDVPRLLLPQSCLRGLVGSTLGRWAAVCLWQRVDRDDREIGCHALQLASAVGSSTQAVRIIGIQSFCSLRLYSRIQILHDK